MPYCSIINTAIVLIIPEITQNGILITREGVKSDSSTLSYSSIWIGVSMRENERDGKKFMEDERERVGNNKTSNFFKFQIMRESFTKST